MKKLLTRSLIITLILQVSGFFPTLWYITQNFSVSSVFAQSPALPIFTVYREAWGLENITTTAQSLSWDTNVAENAEIPLNGGNTSFDLSVGGHYLVMYSVPIRSTWGSNRSEAQSWLRINGTTDVEYSYSSSYMRRADDDFEWYNEGAAIINANAGDDIDLRIQKTDSNTTATMQRTPGRSGINILKLDDDWDYARLRPSAAQAITTTWSDVDLSTSDELDATWYSLLGNDITLSGTWKYLVTYSVGIVTTGTDRTNNETRLTLDGAEIDATRGTAYSRAQNGSFTGIASYVWIIESSSMNQVLNLEIRRESTLQWTTNNTVPGKTGITITKLPDYADYVRVWEVTWGQDMTTAANTPLTFDTTIEQGIDMEHDSINTSEIDINASGDYLFFHSVYNAQNFLNNANRENPYLEWQVSGNTIPYGVSGSYNRHSDDGDGETESSHSSAWVILPWLTSWDRVELTETNEARNGGSTYKWGFMGIQWVSLFSLFSGGWYFSQSHYRWRDDSSDFDVNSGWLWTEDTLISNVSKNEILRLRMKVENPGAVSYGSDSQFELQWAESTGSCTAGLSWNSMDIIDDAWEMVDTSHISPNAETSATLLLSNPLLNTHLQSEWYHSPAGETLLATADTFTSGSQKEYEFSMQATSFALSNTNYCFRLYNIEENTPLSINNYPRLQTGSSPVILADIWWEAGKITAPADGAWTTVTFTWGPYTTPVIVWRTNTYNDGNEALVFESRNLTSTGAQVRLCDSNASNATGCQSHLAETIGYVVADASQTSSIDGVEAWIFTVDESFDTVGWRVTTTYGETFSNIPYVFTSIQSTDGSSPIVTRVSDSTLSNFTGWICQQQWGEDTCNATHPDEVFGWIAIDPTMNPFFRDMDIGSWVSTTPSNLWSTASFSTSFDTIPVGISQTVTNLWGQDVQIDEIQDITTTWMDFRSCELDNDDDCDSHAIDTIRWFAIEEWVFAAEYILDKTHYRWYENNWVNTPVTALEDENTTLNTIPVNKQLRLRMLLQNGDPEVPVWVLSLKLQYAASATCEAAPVWTDVGSLWGGEDWLLFDNAGVTDGSTLTSSLLFWWGHNLQTYSESIPTTSNPNVIPVWEWGEWDFSLIQNVAASGTQYCFRTVTENDDEIEYSSYAMIDTTDNIDPTISSFTPNSWALLPIWNFEIEYEFSDGDSGIDIWSEDIFLQKGDGTIWWADIAGTYISLDTITSTWASYNATGIPFGRYRVWFEISDNAGNTTFIIHEFYVDEIEFIISTPEVDIGEVSFGGTQYTSSDTLRVTVKTVGAEFSVHMFQQTDMDNMWDIIPDWDGTTGFWYESDPYGTMNSFWTWTIIASELRNLHPDWDKYNYTYDFKYSVLLDVLEKYSAWNYEALLDFEIQLDYD